MHFGGGPNGGLDGRRPRFSVLNGRRRAQPFERSVAESHVGSCTATTDDASGEARPSQCAGAAIDKIRLHRQSFEPARPPVAPAPAGFDEAGIRSRHQHEALTGLSIFKRAARKQALADAMQRSAVEIAARRAAEDTERANVQKAPNEAWAALTANEPDVVLSTLEEAFEDNEAPAAAVGVADGEASVVVLVPSTDALPERRPTVTDAGNLSLRKLTKSDKADLYKLLVAGYVLVTIREAFAVAPSLLATRVAVLRASVPDAYGARRLECLLAARFTRQALAGIRWDEADSAKILSDAASDLVLKQTGRTSELQPLDISEHDELQQLVASVDADELLGQV